MNNNEDKKIYITAIVSKIVVVLITFLSSVLINRSLGVELKGEYAYITNLVSIVVPIFSFGIGQTYSTYRRRYGKESLNTFVLLTVFQSAISFVFFLIAYIAKLNYYIWITMLLSTGQILRTNLLYLAAIEDIKKRDFYNIVYKIIYLILLSIIFFFFRGSLNAILFLLIIDEVIIVLGTFYKYKFKLDIKFIKEKGIKLTKIYRLGLVSMLMFLMMTLNYSVDMIFLKKMTNSTVIGLYSVGVQLANMLWLIPDAFKDVIVNKTSKKDSIKEIVFLTKFCLFLSLTIIIGFAIFGRMFIKIAYGQEYVESFIVTLILFIGTMSMIIYKLIHPLYISKGKQVLVLEILTISVIANILLNYIAIPKFGMIGAALSSVVSYGICSLTFLYIFCKEYKVKYSQIFLIKKEDLEHVKKIKKK